MPRTARRRPHHGFKFSSLPPELRLMVWEHTLLPRILHIVQSRHSCMCRAPRHLHSRYKILAPPLPVALYVCHESRDFALKHYKPAFLPPTKHSFRASTRMQRATYFNPDLDVVYFVDSRYDMMIHGLSRHTEETVRTIKVLAVEDRSRKGFGVMMLHGTYVDSLEFPHLWEDLAKFERLEEIICVVRDEMRSGEQYLTRFRHVLEVALGKERKLPVVREVKWEDFEREWS